MIILTSPQHSLTVLVYILQQTKQDRTDKILSTRVLDDHKKICYLIFFLSWGGNSEIFLATKKIDENTLSILEEVLRCLGNVWMSKKVID